MRLTRSWETELPGIWHLTGAAKALVTALFEEIGDSTKEKLLSLGYEPEEDGSLLLSREISADGKTACKIGGRPATVSILRDVAESLINIHGQHDNQSPLSPERHLNNVIAVRSVRAYQPEYVYRYRICADCKWMNGKAQRMDLLTYQVNEIEAAALVPEKRKACKTDVSVSKTAPKFWRAYIRPMIFF